LTAVISIGTSGYTYSWNKGGANKFKWYVAQGFNSVEINGSFYRFPLASWVTNWNTNSPKSFTFSIKVHRAITHYSKFGDKALKFWNRFRKPLDALEEKIEYWLFQMPSSFKYTNNNIEKIKNFQKKSDLSHSSSHKAVIEFRDTSWWSKKPLKELRDAGIAFCSVDAPLLPTSIINLQEITYVRLHGSTQWYNYVYSEKQLNSFLIKIKKARTKKKAIYLNNDHGMLQNGLYLLQHI
jgi:uncharacterized protein YecE (DUF72 family)